MMIETELFTDAKNYAEMAGVDIGELIRIRYLEER